MKHLHEHFDDTEFAHMKVMKGGESWHDFLLRMCGTSHKASIVEKV